MGNVGVWKKQIGDSVSPGDVLVEIETDKAQMDFECQEEGYLAKLLVDTGAKDVPVGMVSCFPSLLFSLSKCHNIMFFIGFAFKYPFYS